MINYRKWCKIFLEKFTTNELLRYIHSKEECPCKANYRICYTCKYSNDDNDTCNEGFDFFKTFHSNIYIHPIETKTKQLKKLKIKLLAKVLKRL